VKKIFVIHIQYVYCGVGSELTVQFDSLKTSIEKIFVVKMHYVFSEVGMDVLIQSGRLRTSRQALSHMIRPFRLSGRSITCCRTVFF